MSKRSAGTPPYTPRKKKARFTNKYAPAKVATGPPALVRKLRYSDTVTVTPSTVPSNYFFSANGMYDPDVTGVGHQPMGFDQYMALYDHYKVLKSKITVEFLPAATNTQSDNVICAIYLDDDTTAITDIHAAIEQGNTAWKACTANSTKSTKLTKGFDHKKMFADKKHSAQIVGASGGNPAEQAYFNVLVGPMNPVNNPTDFRILVTIDFVCQFSERRTLTSS